MLSLSKQDVLMVHFILRRHFVYNSIPTLQVYQIFQGLAGLQAVQVAQ